MWSMKVDIDDPNRWIITRKDPQDDVNEDDACEKLTNMYITPPSTPSAVLPPVEDAPPATPPVEEAADGRKCYEI